MYLGSENPTSHDPIEGHYANFFKVGYNPIEFVIDFGQLYSDAEKEMLHTRIITSPAYARILLDVLRDSIEKYERVFGEVPKSG